ncbi:latent-transforming growth factor beta-binding protein 1-like [Physella acuta]|uniref:latent-transforming growth factor beta-binding protein 1-like n=1 Tax=Physella acuta TaxID=109671 RepID=UPI0027DB7BC6|nr:latent-transforming growth factor beta-binding protein 1-like [Physella acuta]
MSCSYKCANIDDKDTCLCPKGQNVSSDLSTCIDCLDGYYGDNCKEMCPCNKNNTKNCEKINGVCECLQGWKGSNCEIDVDECLENASLCLTKPRSHCVNIGGTYKCDCDTGYIQTTGLSGEQCTECGTGLYGEGCTKPCQCVSENTEHCSNVDGACTCKQGWRGDHCQIDIDECVLAPNLCEMTPHTHCLNTDGSFQCVCNTGYKNYSLVCQECGAGLYGEQCSKTCDCVHNNTEQCNNVDGSCKCKQGWRGDHCQILIDACKDNPNLCSEIPNSHCENSDATYTCVCDEGYIQMDGTLCKAQEKYEEIFSKLVFDFDASNLNLSSTFTADYIHLKSNLEVELTTTLRHQISEIVSIEVIAISIGSLHVDFKTVMKSNGQKHNEVQLTKALVDLMKKNQTLMIDNKPATISIVIYANDQYDKNEKFCDIRKKLEPCLATEFCVEHNQIAICKLIEEEKNLENLIVGLSVSLPLFVLLTIAVGVIVWFCTRRATTQHQKTEEVIELDTMHGLEKSTSVQNAYDSISNDDYNVRRLPRVRNDLTPRHGANLKTSAEYLRASSGR